MRKPWDFGREPSRVVARAAGLAALAAVTLFGPAVATTGKTAIHVQVRQEGRAVAGVRVDFENTSTGNRGYRTTDEHGDCPVFWGTQGVEYLVKPRADGRRYDTAERRIRLGRAATTLTFNVLPVPRVAPDARDRALVTRPLAPVVVAPRQTLQIVPEALAAPRGGAGDECDDPDEDLVADWLARERPLRSGTLDELGYLEVVVGGTGSAPVRRPLREVVGAAFVQHDALRSELARARNRPGVLFGAPTAKDVVHEMREVYLVEFSTEAQVAAPAALRRESKFFDEYLAAREPVPSPADAGDPSPVASAAPPAPEVAPENDAAAAARAERCLARLVAAAKGWERGHPLRHAAESGGAAAVRQAIVDGKGELGLVDALVVPKWTLDRFPGDELTGVPPSEGPLSQSRPEDPDAPLPLLGNLSAAARFFEVSARSERVALGNGPFLELGSEGVFLRIPLGDQVVALWSVHSERFLAVGGDGLVRASEMANTPSALFVEQRNGRDSFKLLSVRNGKGLELRGGELAASADGPGVLFFWREPQWRPTISGRVRWGGRAVAGVAVEIVDVATGQRLDTGVTRADGSFSFRAPQLRRSLRITPALAGWKIAPQNVRLVTGRDARNLEFAATPEVETRSSGSAKVESQFLTGFTKGTSWEWQKKWKYTSGFFRVSFGAGYGIGLRAPVSFTQTIAPTAVEVQGPVDPRPGQPGYRELPPVALASRAVVRDEGAAFYSRSGLADARLFRGREAVLEAGVEFGTKFRVFWTTIFHVRKRHFGFDYSKDMSWPYGGVSDCLPRIVVPGTVSRTWFDLGVLAGGLESGLQLCGDGEVTSGLDWRFDGSTRARDTIRLADARAQASDEFRLPEMDRHGSASFGYRLAAPSYRTDLTARAQLRLAVRVGTRRFHRNFGTPWLTLLDLHLGPIRLPPHDGTRDSLLWEEGEKTFSPGH